MLKQESKSSSRNFYAKLLTKAENTGLLPLASSSGPKAQGAILAGGLQMPVPF